MSWPGGVGLQLSSELTPGRPFDHGKAACARCSPNTTSTDTLEKASTERAYAGQLCCVSPPTPSNRYAARSTREWQSEVNVHAR